MLRILFICPDNASRSLMAEGFANLFFNSDCLAYSAGLAPAALPDARALEFMREVGCDLGDCHCKGMQALCDLTFNVVISLGERHFATPRATFAFAHWRVEDPALLDNARYRDVRHFIGHRVRQLARRLSELPDQVPQQALDMGSE